LICILAIQVIHFCNETFFSSFSACLSVEHREKISQYFQTLMPSNQAHYADQICDSIICSHLNEATHAIVKSADERWILIGSVRLDNEMELKSMLPEFTYDNQEQLILSLFASLGTELFCKLIGDFSFMIYDRHRQMVWAVKDHLGIRPLFYYQQDKGVLFGSTVGAILNALTDEPGINQDYLASELSGIPGPVSATLFDRVLRLEGAHFLTYDIQQNQLKKTRYWELKPKAQLDEKQPRII